MAEITIVIHDNETLETALKQLGIVVTTNATVVSGDAPMVSDLAKQTIEDITSEPPAPETPAAPSGGDQLPDDVNQWIGQGEQQQEVDLDADGVPWDERIHSGNHKKAEKSGKWIKRKGVDAALHKQVTAELQQLMQNTGGGGVDVPPAPPVPETPPAPPQQSAPPAPAAPPAAPQAPATSAAWDWPKLLMATTHGFQNGLFTMEQRNTALAELGVADFALLSTQPDKFETFANSLGLVAPE